MIRSGAGVYLKPFFNGNHFLTSPDISRLSFVAKRAYAHRAAPSDSEWQEALIRIKNYHENPPLSSLEVEQGRRRHALDILHCSTSQRPEVCPCGAKAVSSELVKDRLWQPEGDSVCSSALLEK